MKETFQEVVFDTASLETLDELHGELARLLDFPDHYGRNLDALYDCLSGEIALPLKVVWRHYGQAEAAIGSDVRTFRSVLEEFAAEDPRFVVEVIEEEPI
jgi:ribonuclease inhibitor